MATAIAKPLARPKSTMAALSPNTLHRMPEGCAQREAKPELTGLLHDRARHQPVYPHARQQQAQAILASAA